MRRFIFNNRKTIGVMLEFFLAIVLALLLYFVANKIANDNNFEKFFLPLFFAAMFIPAAIAVRNKAFFFGESFIHLFMGLISEGDTIRVKLTDKPIKVVGINKGTISRQEYQELQDKFVHDETASQVLKWMVYEDNSFSFLLEDGFVVPDCLVEQITEQEEEV